MKRAAKRVAGLALAGICLLILYSVPWAKIAPTILGLVVALAVIFFFFSWRNRVTFVWPTEFGQESRTINRPLYSALHTQFSAYLRKHGFKLVADPKSDKNINFWIVKFRSGVFELSFGDRPDVLVNGRPTYCQEDWYSIPVVFAVLDGVDNIAIDESDLDQLANAIAVRHSELCHFFSPQGEDLRLIYAHRAEQNFWRMLGKDGIPKDAT